MTKTYTDLLSITQGLDDKKAYQSLYILLKHPAQDHNSFFSGNDAANLRMLDEYVNDQIDQFADDYDNKIYSSIINLTKLSNRLTDSPLTFKSLSDAGGWFDGLLSSITKGINPGYILLSKTPKPDFSDVDNIICVAFSELNVIYDFMANQGNFNSIKKNTKERPEVDYSIINSSKLFCVKDREMDESLAISNAVQALISSKVNFLPMPDDFATFSLKNSLEAITGIFKSTYLDIANNNNNDFIKITVMPLSGIQTMTNNIDAVVRENPLWPQFLNEASQFIDPVFITISINPLLIPDLDLLQNSISVVATRYVANSAINAFLEEYN